MKIGVIGGSGLYEMETIQQKRWIRLTTPFGKPSDHYLTGRIADRDLVFLPRHGRGHKILPSELNHRANIYGMKKLGVSHIISVSAVGSLKEQYKPTDIVAIDQFIDRTKRSADFTFFGNGVVAHIAFADPICNRLRHILVDCARRAGATVHDGGTYVNMEGPAFSTRAESHFHRRMEWDVVGMTNYGEARCAREAEICYATLAMVTDYDCWHRRNGRRQPRQKLGDRPGDRSPRLRRARPRSRLRLPSRARLRHHDQPESHTPGRPQKIGTPPPKARIEEISPAENARPPWARSRKGDIYPDFEAEPAPIRAPEPQNKANFSKTKPCDKMAHLDI
jgi:5'-methylthioadenosine phosphorylase